LQTAHEVEGRDRVWLKGRRVERGPAFPVPVSVEFRPGSEGSEGDLALHERFIEHDDVRSAMFERLGRGPATCFQGGAIESQRRLFLRNGGVPTVLPY